jgi:HK97 family phage portal protein
MTATRPPLLTRLSTALRTLRGQPIVAPGGTDRAIIETTYPNFPAGIAQASLVRTANPQEYKPDGATIRVQGFSRHPVVHACIRVVADIVASVPLVVLQERGNRESRVDESHPLQRLLDYPGPRFTARQMRARYAVDFLGYGNAFFQMDRPGPTRPPVALRSVNAESIQTVWVDADGDARRYDYGNWAGIIVQVPVEDMIHFKDLEMSRPFAPDVFGFPRGATAIASMTADNEATQYVRQVVTNDGTPTFAVLLSDEATQDDAVAMQDRYKARVVDRGKRGSPAFFGAVRDIKPLGFTLSDLEFPSLRRVSREDICAAYGVDPRMIGIASATSDAGLSGAQYAEARARLVQHTIEPMLSAIEDELNNWLAPEFGDVWITYDHDILRDLVENDMETSARVRAEFAASLRTWEESRAALKLSPIPEPTDTLAMNMGTTLVPAATAVIDPRMVMDQTGEAAGTLPAGNVVATGDVQATALNGAQTTALIDMLNQAANNLLPIETVYALMKAAFPGVPESLIEDMLGGLSGFVPPSPEPTQANANNTRPPATDNETPAVGAGPMVSEDEDENDAEDEESPEGSARSRRREQVRAMADQALSGEQIEALLELLESVVEKELPIDAVTAVILAAFPKIDRELVAQMVAAAAMFEPTEEEEPEAPENGEPEMPEKAAALMWWERLTPEELEAEPRYQYWRQAMDELDRREVSYYDKAIVRFRSEKASVGAMFGVGNRAAKTQDEILAGIKRKIRDAYTDEDGEYYRAWRESYRKLTGETYMVGAKQSAKAKLSFSLESPEVLAAIDNRTGRLAELVGRTTSDQILAAIRAGEKGGLSVAEIGRLVQASVFGETVTDARARTIARTESAGAMSQGNWDQAQAMGDLYRSKEWLAFEDNRTRETHLACMAQGRIPFEDRFSNGLEYPLDPAGDAAEVVNCRCVLAYYDTTVEEAPR